MSLLVMDQRLEIGSIRFPAVRKVTLDTSRDTPSDKCTIELPRYKNLKKDDIKIGQKVVWLAGYKQHGLINEFSGSVEEVTFAEPITVVARDEMYRLSLQYVQKNFYETPLGQFLDEVAPGVERDVRVNPFNVTVRAFGKTARYALWELRRLYGMDVFIQGGALVVESQSDKRGFITVPTFIKPAARSGDQKRKKSGITGYVISDEVTMRPPRNLKITVRSEDIQSGIIASASYGSGPEKVVTIDGLSGGRIYDRAKEIWEEHRDRFDGTFTTFGWPSVQHSQMIEFLDEDGPERSGKCWVDRVQKVFEPGNASYRQTVYPARLSSDRRSTVKVGAGV